ncbi:MAG: formylglycine-generating enzyme family protein [Elusimicrobiota bacterium]
MKNWKICSLVAVLAITAGVAFNRNSGGGIPSDLRDAVADNREFSTAVPAVENKGNIPASKGYVVENAPAPGAPVEWVEIAGGRFMMGTDSEDKKFTDAKPAHQVFVKDFQLSRTPVTVEQYGECVAKAKCTEPGTEKVPGSKPPHYDYWHMNADEVNFTAYCNWKVKGHEQYPVNCVSFKQATDYAKFADARLPTEAEWEYAATGGGRNQKYPWGNDNPSPEKVVMDFCGGYAGCPGLYGPKPVCSKPAGNAKLTGGELCDMAGNVWQWVLDGYKASYKGAPANGLAVKGSAKGERVVRGGSFGDYGGPADGATGSFASRSDYRGHRSPAGQYDFLGFRLAR